jgi:YVTN family beta-propeller protein
MSIYLFRLQQRAKGYSRVSCASTSTNSLAQDMVNTRRLRSRVCPRSRLLVFACVALSLASLPAGGYAQGVVATVAIPNAPNGIALNPVTNKIYLITLSDNRATIIDGATNLTSSVPVGGGPTAIAVNPTTNRIYVTNGNDNTVTVIDGATGTVIAAAVMVGNDPVGVAVNPVTNKIYTVNQGDSTVSVIDGLTGTASQLTVGAQPVSVAVNQVTNKIYVANQTGNSVTVIDGATATAGAPVVVGTQPSVVAVNPVTNKIYVLNDCGNTACSSGIPGGLRRSRASLPFGNTLGSVTIIDGATGAVTATVAVGNDPFGLAVNPGANKIYVTNSSDGTVTVIDGATSAASSLVSVGNSPRELAVNPTTNQVYVANFSDNNVTVIDGLTNATVNLDTGTSPLLVAVNPVTNQAYIVNINSNSVTVIDGATNVTAVVAVGSSSQRNGSSIAANPATNKIYVPNSFSNTVSVIDGTNNSATTISSMIGTIPNNLAVNPVTNNIYVTNLADGTVSVIDGSTDTVSDVVTVGFSSQTNRTSIAANPVTNKIYVPNSFSNTVTVIDGATNLTTTITLGIGSIPNAVAINPATNKIYVTNLGDGTVSVIDGSTDTVSAVVTVGFSSQANGTSIAVNPVTNKIYVPNSFSNTVTVIDGPTNATTTVTTGIGTDPNAVAINPITNKIYVTNLADGTVSVIDGVTNAVTVVTVGFSSQANRTSIAVNLATDKIYVTNSFSNSLTVIDGASNTTTTLTAGIGTIPNAIAINLATNDIYVTNLADATVSAISDEQVQAIPLVTSIAPQPGNVTGNLPIFALTAATTFAPTAPPITAVYYQVDTWEGPWIAAAPAAGSFTAPVSPALLQGTHVVYAYAIDGQDANSTGMAQQLIGRLTAEVFTVILPGTTTVVTSDNNPASVAQTVTFSAQVSSTSSGIPTGIVTFFDGISSLGTGTLDGSGAATFGTALLTLGSHSITAVYSGDGNFAGSTSAAVTETIVTPNPVPTVTSLSPATGLAGGPSFTLTINGTNFTSSSTVEWNGVALTTTFVSATQLTATVPSGDLVNSGTVMVTVFNPTPGGGTSITSLTFTINNPVPVLVSISQNSAVAGGPAFTLTVAGNSFVSTSVVRWNNQPLATTFVSSTQLTATVPGSDVQTSGIATVTVFNPTPGGGLSNVATFIITVPLPVLVTITPNSTTSGSSAFTLTLTGAAFISTSVARWNGANLPTTFVNSTQLTALIPATDVLAVGTASVAVFNPGVVPTVVAKIHPDVPGSPGKLSNALTFTITNANPVPVLVSISQNSAVAGGPAFTLTVTGSSFVNTSVVRWNNQPLSTTFVSSTQLTATVPSSDLQNSGIAAVTVFSPMPGGGVSSNVETFTITVPVPVLVTISPNTATAGSAAFTLTLTGSAFISTSVARWNGTNLPTTFLSSTQLTALIPAADVLTVGTASVVVFNPQTVVAGVLVKIHPAGSPPSGQLSNALTFTITDTNPVPALVSLSPASAAAGGSAFVLTLTGTNFVSNTVVQWNGMALTTTFVSSTQISAIVPSSDIAIAGTASITSFNPAPGGGTSNVLGLSVNGSAPTLSSLSQTSTVVGGPTFTLTLNGSNFVSGTVVKWNGVAVVTTFVNGAQITAVIPASNIATAGNFSVTIFTPAPGGGTSTPLNFAIVDFAVSSATPTQSVAAGQSAMFAIATAPVIGPFPGLVVLKATGLPSGALATFSPASVSAGAGASMSVTTTVRTSSVAVRNPFGPIMPGFPAALASMSILTLAMLVSKQRIIGLIHDLRRPLIPHSALVLLVLIAGCLGGCAQGFPKVTTGTGTATGTPAGTYVITVTGTSGTDKHSTTVTLIVQ